MAKQEPHVHNYKKLGYMREVGRTSRSNRLVPDAPGKTIDRIILYHECECGGRQAFECGDKNKMRVLYARLTNLEGKKDWRKSG